MPTITEFYANYTCDAYKGAFGKDERIDANLSVKISGLFLLTKMQCHILCKLKNTMSHFVQTKEYNVTFCAN